LHTLSHLLARWSAFLWVLLKPLGSWGVFAIAAIDAAFVGLPLDPLVGGYVYRHPTRLWLYVLMASAGSALGSLILYAVGYEMGELVLEKRMGAAKFARMRERFERHEFLALMLPAMMPPPFPFKLFALSAAVFEMHFSHFLIAIFAGRVARFLILSVLVLKFGPRAVPLVAGLFRAHLDWLLIGLALAAIIAAVFWWVTKKRRATSQLASKENATDYTD
jgi:membrane protein YqaA with SNARE-associated domain